MKVSSMISWSFAHSIGWDIRTTMLRYCTLVFRCPVEDSTFMRHIYIFQKLSSIRHSIMAGTNDQTLLTQLELLFPSSYQSGPANSGNFTAQAPFGGQGSYQYSPGQNSHGFIGPGGFGGMDGNLMMANNMQGGRMPPSLRSSPAGANRPAPSPMYQPNYSLSYPSESGFVSENGNGHAVAVPFNYGPASSLQTLRRLSHSLGQMGQFGPGGPSYPSGGYTDTSGVAALLSVSCGDKDTPSADTTRSSNDDETDNNVSSCRTDTSDTGSAHVSEEKNGSRGGPSNGLSIASGNDIKHRQASYPFSPPFTSSAATTPAKGHEGSAPLPWWRHQQLPPQPQNGKNVGVPSNSSGLVDGVASVPGPREQHVFDQQQVRSLLGRGPEPSRISTEEANKIWNELFVPGLSEGSKGRTSDSLPGPVNMNGSTSDPK
jgi:hypothetical protein